MSIEIWNGWWAGIAIGVYALLQLSLTGKPLGASTAFGNLCAAGSRLPYFRREFPDPFNWRIWFVVGLPLGGLLGAATSSGFDGWAPTFNMGRYYNALFGGDGVTPFKIGGMLLGGVFIGYGARLAGGCNSGHSIAGMSFLNPYSFLASAGFFAGGIIAVNVAFRLLLPAIGAASPSP